MLAHHSDPGVPSRRFIIPDRTAILFCGLAVGWIMRGGFDGPAPPALAPLPAAPPTAMAPQERSALDGAVMAGRPIRIGVYGDSFGDGAWAALLRAKPSHSGFVLTKFSAQGAGLAHLGATDLLPQTQAQLNRWPVEIAVVSLGANDTRALLVDGRAAPFGSPAWARSYGDRVEGLVQKLQSGGAEVDWLGLPRMRDPRRDQDVGLLQAVVQQRVAHRGAAFVPVTALSTDTSGRYAAYLPDDTGRLRLMRAGDGVHMSGAGYDRLAAPLWRAIQASVAQARSRAASRYAKDMSPPLADAP